MPLRDLLCVLEAAEEPTAALDQAVALARGYRAHARFEIAAPEVLVADTFYSAPVVSGIVAQDRAQTRARADALAERVRAASAAVGLGFEVDKRFEVLAELLTVLKGRARCFDLVVMDRPGALLGHGEALFEEMLFGTGRPVLVATPDRAPVGKVKHVVLAWDGSAQAAHVLSIALALFPEIKLVEVVSVAGEKDLSETVPGAEIAPHIERHGAEAKVFDLMMEKGGVAPVIDNFASDAKADLIVMGGFGHSRWREFVLGGVTRALSKSAKTPLLLAH